MTADIVAFAGGTAEDFAMWAREIRQARVERSSQPARVRLFDGDYVMRGEVVDYVGGGLNITYNDAGSISVELPIDVEDRRGTYLAHWALDQDARGTTNIHVIIEKDGARIGGFADPDAAVRLVADENKVVLTFIEDTGELKFVQMAAAPFLPPSLIQQPKEQLLYCPVDWGGKATLGANSLRNQGTNFNMNLDLLDPATWSGGLWAQAQIVPMPGKLGDSVAPPTIITGNIKQSWLEVMQPRLEDAELQIVTRRFLDGDPEPFPGAGTSWRQGTLFVDIVDKSGWRSGTSLGGNLATGLLRSIANVTSNYVEDSYDLVTGAPTEVHGYKIPGILSTQPSHPYVVYVHGQNSGIEGFELTRGPGGPVRITAGGQSMPGVNELMEAVVGYAGDVIGDNINISGYGIGSLGNILNAFLMPILKDSILANMSVWLPHRAADQGWAHRLETACTGVTQAYTPAAMMDLRRRRRETDPRLAFLFDVVNAQPFLIGDNGVGHWWLGDRAGATSPFTGAKVYVARCRELSLDLLDPQWKAKFGDLRAQQDALEKAIGTAVSAFSALNAIGVG